MKATGRFCPSRMKVACAVLMTVAVCAIVVLMWPARVRDSVARASVSDLVGEDWLGLSGCDDEAECLVSPLMSLCDCNGTTYKWKVGQSNFTAEVQHEDQGERRLFSSVPRGRRFAKSIANLDTVSADDTYYMRYMFENKYELVYDYALIRVRDIGPTNSARGILLPNACHDMNAIGEIDNLDQTLSCETRRKSFFFKTSIWHTGRGSGQPRDAIFMQGHILLAPVPWAWLSIWVRFFTRPRLRASFATTARDRVDDFQMQSDDAQRNLCDRTGNVILCAYDEVHTWSDSARLAVTWAQGSTELGTF